MIRAFLSACVALGVHTSSARAGFVINTPAGLNPGDKFFVVFLDSTLVSATSTDITTYQNDITTAASGITYSGGTIGAYHVIGATPSTNDATTLSSDTSTHVYNLNSQLQTTSGGSYISQGLSPSIDQNGNTAPGAPVWTGLGALAKPSATQELGGSSGETAFGVNGALFSTVGLFEGAAPSQDTADLYGFALLTVGPTTSAVPELSSISLAFVGVVGLVVGRGARRCRRASASGPTGCS
jgi:hypothetical protein